MMRTCFWPCSVGLLHGYGLRFHRPGLRVFALVGVRQPNLTRSHVPTEVSGLNHLLHHLLPGRAIDFIDLALFSCSSPPRIAHKGNLDPV